MQGAVVIEHFFIFAYSYFDIFNITVYSIRTLLTMPSTIVGSQRSWTCTWPSSSTRWQTWHGLALLHAWHGPLALYCHLQVVWKRLSTCQHLIRHDLCPKLVQLVLVKGRWIGGRSGCITLSSRAARLGISALEWTGGGAGRGKERPGGRRGTGWKRTGDVIRGAQWRRVTLRCSKKRLLPFFKN